MSWHRSFAARQSGKPVWLAAAAVGFTMSLLGFYNYGYKPWARRQRLTQAEKYADYIFEKEKRAASTDSQF
ncbi:hypothetical protein JTB14_012429 [Gonioctena quinquepunctata]|nr:hypothetical protein JTB14_012429 [Gonioctena quinquepunctata]